MKTLGTILCGIFAAVLTARGQDVPDVAKGAIAFNLSIKRAYTGTNAFSAKIGVSFNSEQSMGMELRIFQSNSVLASELDFSEMKNFPPRAREKLRELGIDRQATILDTANRRLDIIFPRLAAYVEMEL